MKRKANKALVSRDPDVVRSRILGAAQAEFMAAGFEAASTNRITTGFAGSKATLFRYYRTKEQLLEAVLHRIADRWQRAVDLQSLPDRDPREWLTGCGQRTLAWILGPEPLFVGRLAIAEGHKFPTLDHVFVDHAVRPLQASVAARLGAWTRQGLLCCATPHADAELFLDLVVAGEVSRALYGTPLRGVRARARHVERAVELFLNGVAAPARAKRSARRKD